MWYELISTVWFIVCLVVGYTIFQKYTAAQLKGLAVFATLVFGGIVLLNAIHLQGLTH